MFVSIYQILYFLKSGTQWQYRFLLLLISLTQGLSAQNLGRNPNGQNWQQIKSPSATFLYPNGLDSVAINTANLLNHQAKHHRPIGTKTAHVPILLHNQSLLSNGYVGLAPFRSEFFISPPQSFRQLGTTPWSTLLAIHEYRHVLQNANAKVGISKIAYWLFGEIGWSGFSHFSIPNWFWEGDAVLSETYFSESGRGRLPFFTLQQRTIAQAGKHYSYNKIRNGSFRDLVPNHYVWGNTLLSYLENKKGSEVIPELFHDAAAYKKPIYSFSRALKEHSGLTTLSLYDSAWQASKKLWKERLSKREFTPHQLIKEEKGVHFYYFPQFTNKGELVVWENSYQQTDRIVVIDSLKNRTLVKPGFTFDRYFHLQDSLLVWTESSVNGRRNRAEFSDVVLYNQKSKQKIKLSKKGRFFSPIISRDGRSVYAIMFTKNLSCEVVKIKLSDQSQQVLFTFAYPSYISRLAEDSSGNLYTILQENNTVSIVRLEEKNSFKRISEASAHSMDDICIHGDYLYFTASFNQIDNIYRININQPNEIIQLTSSTSGAYHPSVNKNSDQLIFSEGKLNGFKLSALELKNAIRQPISITEPKNQVWQLNNSHLRNVKLLNELADSTYQANKYKGLFRGFRMHSWPITATQAKQEINVEFDNYLNEISATAGGGYNINEKATYYQAGLSYGKWFPVFSLNAQRSFREFDRIESERFLIRKNTQQDAFRFTTSIPLSFIKSNYRHQLQASVSYQFTQLQEQNFSLSEDFHLGNAQLSYAVLRRTAYQNLAPRFGFNSLVNYGVQFSSLQANRLRLQFRTYLPGFAANHSFQLLFAYQQEDLTNPYQWLDFFAYTRGYNTPLNDSYYTFSANYHLPLVYPDWGFWGISYFKRIRANLFFDYGEGKLNVIERLRSYSSIGSEISFDNVWFNWTELSIGVRSAYRLQDAGNEKKGEWQQSLYFSTSF